MVSAKTADKVHSGSADSGQSSSPDSSSSIGSIADDSLEEQAKHHQEVTSVEGEMKEVIRQEDVDDKEQEQDNDVKQIVKNYQDAAANKLALNNNNNNTLKTTTTPTIQESISMQQPQVVQSQQQQQSVKSEVISNNNNNVVDSDSQRQSIKLEETPEPQKNSSTNYSGLNFNMTASEMRELIARRKKFDPKKAQMNIRQKYEIIQQM